MAVEIEVKGQKFRLNPLSAMQQLHVARRLTPMLAALAPGMGALQGAGPEALGRALEPVADVLAAMPDAEFEYLVTTCLGTVQGNTAGDAWGPLYVGKTCMRHDLDGEMTLMLTVRVIKESLGPFIAGFLTSPSPGQEPATS